MDAVVIDEFESFDVIDIPRPEPSTGEVLIDVSRVQLSVTECLLYRGESVAHYDAVKRQIRDGNPGAQLFGHEFCGVVAECGPGVDDYQVGDRVYAPGKIHCGECPYCRSGYENYCPDTEAIGYDRPGALAEYVRLPVEPIQKIPEGVSDAEGAALQPLASSVLCVADAEIDPGDDVLVIGAGVMGFQCALLAKRFGARTVYAADVRDRPLELVAANGAIPIDATETDPVETVREATGDSGQTWRSKRSAAPSRTRPPATIRSHRRSVPPVAAGRFCRSATSRARSRRRPARPGRRPSASRTRGRASPTSDRGRHGDARRRTRRERCGSDR